MMLCSKYSRSLLYNPPALPHPHTHACLWLVLYSRVFLVMLYLTSGKMNASQRERKRESLYWNRCLFFPERCYKQRLRWSGPRRWEGQGARQWSVRAWFLFHGTRRTRSQFFHTFTQLDNLNFQCHIPAFITRTMISGFKTMVYFSLEVEMTCTFISFQSDGTPLLRGVTDPFRFAYI